MRKRIISAFAVVALVVTAMVATASPAMAASPAACTNWSSWIGSSTGWGQFRYCSAVNPDNGNTWYRFQVDDTLTDGYAVHVEIESFYTSCCSPSYLSRSYDDVIYDSSNGLCFQSVGSVATSAWWGTYTVPSQTWIYAKLVRGRACGPPGGHQDTADYYYTIHT